MALTSAWTVSIMFTSYLLQTEKKAEFLNQAVFAQLGISLIHQRAKCARTEHCVTK